MSTGSRSSLADYSGYVYSDINCQAIYMGYYYQREFYGASFFRQYIAFGYNVNLSFIGSGVDMNDKLILYDNAPENDDFVQTNKNTFNALGIYTDPVTISKCYILTKKRSAIKLPLIIISHINCLTIYIRIYISGIICQR